MAPLSVIPPPSAVPSVGVATVPNSRFLSATVRVVLSIVNVVPVTVKSPPIYKSHATLSPPSVCNDPSVVVVAFVVSSVVIFPPIYAPHTTLSPPSVCNAPSVVVVAFVVSA